MPVTANTLEEAISITNSRVGVGSNNNLLKQYISTFNAEWAPAFKPSKENDRLVRNWIVKSKIVEAATPDSGNQQERQNVVDIACRVMYATIAAFDANKINSDQRDAVLDAWNASFGAAP